jgi:uncharacterized protein YceK
MNWNGCKMLHGLAMILLLTMMQGCASILPTGVAKADRTGTPYICAQDWMQDQSYAGDDGDKVQQVGEDTPETIKEARKKNAQRRGYCK